VFKAIYKAGKLLTVYSLLFPLIFSLAMENDTSVSSSYFGYHTEPSSVIEVLIIVLFVYVLRLFFLLWPKITEKKYAGGWVKGGTIAAFLPEFILIRATLSNLFEKGSSCATYNIFSNCGWSGVLYAIIGVSFGFQIVGMLLGRLTGKGT